MSLRAPAIVLAVVLLAGCATDPVSQEPVGQDDDAVVDVKPEPVVQEFRGFMAASQVALLAHQDAETEMLLADVQREGFVLEVVEVPESLEIQLEWGAANPGSEMFAMVNIPTAVEGQVLDVLSDWSGAGSLCMGVPLDEVEPGYVSMMAHSRDAVGVEWLMRITSVGGEVVVHAERGHMEVERSDGELRDALPCLDG